VEFYDLLKRVKKLEDQVSCPCEPNKADYIGMIRQRLDAMEKAADIKDRDWRTKPITL
jgi:hypothetical protein